MAPELGTSRIFLLRNAGLSLRGLKVERGKDVRFLFDFKFKKTIFSLVSACNLFLEVIFNLKETIVSCIFFFTKISTRAQLALLNLSGVLTIFH